MVHGRRIDTARMCERVSYGRQTMIRDAEVTTIGSPAWTLLGAARDGSLLSDTLTETSVSLVFRHCFVLYAHYAFTHLSRTRPHISDLLLLRRQRLCRRHARLIDYWKASPNLRATSWLGCDSVAGRRLCVGMRDCYTHSRPLGLWRWISPPPPPIIQVCGRCRVARLYTTPPLHASSHDCPVPSSLHNFPQIKSLDIST